MNKPNKKNLAVVFSGGGARGAYEAGVIHYIRTQLPKNCRERVFDIQTGASVGAINASYLAATSHDIANQGNNIFKVWSEIKEESIYHRGTGAIFKFLGNSSRGILSNIIFGAQKSKTHFKSFLDTAPLQPLLKKIIDWPQIRKNVDNQVIKALALVATNVGTGKTELFVDKHKSLKYTGIYPLHQTHIGPEHAMASAAIPLIFSSVLVDDIAYIDGGLRLNTPMSPAIQLGADSILVISLHHERAKTTPAPFSGTKGKLPSMGQVIGRIMNSLFLDHIQYDMEQLVRINRIIDWVEMKYGKDALNEINVMLRDKGITGDIANRGLKRLNVLKIGPSQDLGELFNTCYQKRTKNEFTSFEKLMARILDIDPNSGFDFLSYITFMPSYIKLLLELGFEDAKKKHHELEKFLSPES